MRPELASVVIPARHAAGTLGEQLDAVAAQDYEGPFEVVVAVNGGHDGTGAVARSWVAAHGGRVVDASGRRGPGAARNAGVRAARGDFLAFCDADDVVAPGWLSALTAADADLVAGVHDDARLNVAAMQTIQQTPQPGEPWHGFLPAVSGANCGVRRAVFDAVGGFDESSLAGEDVAFSWRAQLAGFRLAVAEGAVVHKRFRPNRCALGTRFVRYGMGDAWLYSEFAAAGMPRRPLAEAAAEWGHVLRGLPSQAGEPGRGGRVVLMSGLLLGRLAGSIRYGTVFL